jgi:N-acetyl-1-D-myo-inositol-2-amino-2-deoxy-alpha-D-glucopyranoside deacetylase
MISKEHHPDIMSNQQTLLIVTAHPDDETFGSGGALAKYASDGVKVYCACATRGEVGTFEAEHMKGHATVGDMRWAEFECAARVLGLAGVIHLGFRDSGMVGSADNVHPQALVNAPVDDVAARVVKVIRELKPQVIITSDPIGGYHHPDHIAIHKATLKAFQAAGDPRQLPEAGLPYKAQKLYYNVFPRGIMKVTVTLMPLFGQDPHHLGKNRDIDLASVANVKFPMHAVLRLSRRDRATRDKATACYVSQIVNRPKRRGLFGFLQRLTRDDRDYFMRAYPAVQGRLHERDLFEGTT